MRVSQLLLAEAAKATKETEQAKETSKVATKETEQAKETSKVATKETEQAKETSKEGPTSEHHDGSASPHFQNQHLQESIDYLPYEFSPLGCNEGRALSTPSSRAWGGMATVSC